MTETVRNIQSPILPAPITRSDQLAFWSRQVTEAIVRSFDTFASRIETLNQTESSSSGGQPDAVNLRGFYYDETEGRIYFDDGDWNEIGGPGSASSKIIVASSEPADSELDANEGAFWYVNE